MNEKKDKTTEDRLFELVGNSNDRIVNYLSQGQDGYKRVEDQLDLFRSKLEEHKEALLSLQHLSNLHEKDTNEIEKHLEDVVKIVSEIIIKMDKHSNEAILVELNKAIDEYKVSEEKTRQKTGTLKEQIFEFQHMIEKTFAEQIENSKMMYDNSLTCHEDKILNRINDLETVVNGVSDAYTNNQKALKLVTVVVIGFGVAATVASLIFNLIIGPQIKGKSLEHTIIKVLKQVEKNR